MDALRFFMRIHPRHMLSFHVILSEAKDLYRKDLYRKDLYRKDLYRKDLYR